MIPYDVTHLVRPEGFPVPTLSTLVTSQFFHGSWPHLLANLLFFVAFAPALERSLGHVRFAALYLTCGILGALAQVWVSIASHVPIIGASGAIAGILGAYLVRFPTHRLAGVPAIAIVGLWAAIQFIHGFAPLATGVLSERGGATAYFAHIGGFLAGVILAGLFGNGRAPLANGGRSSYNSR